MTLVMSAARCFSRPSSHHHVTEIMASAKKKKNKRGAKKMKRIVAAFAAAALASASHAATFTSISDQILLMDGEIVEGDNVRLIAAVTAANEAGKPFNRWCSTRRVAMSALG